MGFLGSSKNATNSTAVANDNRTQDNKVAAQDSTVISTAGGALTDSSGSINATGSISITQTDPNSYGFASKLIDQVFGANATTLANARSQAATATESLGRAAEAAQAAVALPVAGSSWQTWAKWGAIVAGAGFGVVLLVKFIRRKK